MDGNYNENNMNGNEMRNASGNDGGMMRYGNSGMSTRHSGEEGPWEVIAEMVAPFINHYDGEDVRYSRNQPRTSTGRFKRMRYSHELEGEKEEVAMQLAREFGREELLDKAIKEAFELIKCAAKTKLMKSCGNFPNCALWSKRSLNSSRRISKNRLAKRRWITMPAKLAVPTKILLKNMRAVVVAATGDNNILERVGTKSALVLHTILHTKSYKKFPSE